MNRLKLLVLMLWKTRRPQFIAGLAGGVLLVYSACVFWPWKTLKFQGYMEGEYVYVASPVAGRLEKLAVHRGDDVQPSQILFNLEPEPECQQQAQVQAQLVLAGQNLQRARELIVSHSISQKEYDQTESEEKALSQSLAQIQWRLDQKKQTARSSAYVQDTFYVQGEWVPEGRAVVSLLPPENIKVRFFVDASLLPKIKAGQVLSMRAFGLHEDIPGRVIYISKKAEYTPPVIYSNETRSKLTFMIEAMPDSTQSDKLHPGQPVEIKLK